MRVTNADGYSYEPAPSVTGRHVVMCPAARAAALYVPSHLLPDSVQETVTAADLFQFAG